MPPAPELVPVDTSVALTLAAEPRTDTPTLTATFTLIPSLQSNASTQAVEQSLDDQLYIVLYIGIDAPGMVQPIEWKSPEAVNTNSSLVSGQYVTLAKDVSEVDPNGYLLRYVIANSTFVNLQRCEVGWPGWLSYRRIPPVQPPFWQHRSKRRQVCWGYGRPP